MFEDLKKMLDKGLDYATMTRDKVTQAAKDMARENNLTKEEAKKLLDHLVKKSDEARKALEANVQELIQVSLKKMRVPTQEDVRKLEERIKKLEATKKTPAKSKPRVKPSPKKPVRKQP